MARRSCNTDIWQQVGGWVVPTPRHGAAAIENEGRTCESVASVQHTLARDPVSRLLAGLTIADWERLAVAAGFQPEPLASLCGVRLRLLERFFQRRFGQTPVAWMREVRCRRGVTLLLNGAHTKEAADVAGYASSSQFCHEFKKLVGVSPKRYVRAAVRRGGGG